MLKSLLTWLSKLLKILFSEKWHLILLCSSTNATVERMNKLRRIGQIFTETF
jgi:hypothetical protein